MVENTENNEALALEEQQAPVEEVIKEDAEMTTPDDVVKADFFGDGDIFNDVIKEKKEDAAEDKVAARGELPTAEPASEVITEAPKEEVFDASKEQLNYKFKADGKEHDFPEHIKALATSPELHKSYRKLLEKQKSFDDLRDKYGSINDFSSSLKELTDLREQKQKMDEVTSYANKLFSYVKGDKKDLDAFFKDSGITEQDLYNHFETKYQVESLSPEDREIWNKQQEAEKMYKNTLHENELLKQQARMHEQSQFKNVVDSQKRMLETITKRPDIAEAIDITDRYMGKDSFKQKMTNYVLSAASLKQPITLQVAAEKALADLKPAINNLKSSEQMQRSNGVVAEKDSIPRFGRGVVNASPTGGASLDHITEEMVAKGSLFDGLFSDFTTE